MNQAHCYAIRLVNPYTGVLQVIDLGMARGLSRNGFNWEIQVRVEAKANGWGSLNRSRTELKYYRYGFWNSAQGLTRLPQDPSLDGNQLREGYRAMLHELRSGALDALPFPFEDCYEFWLLDQQHHPLALLGTTCDRQMIPKIRDQQWHASIASLQLDDFSQAKIEALERLIRTHANKRQWFQRTPDGGGTGLEYRTAADLIGRQLSAEAFPQLLVRTDWEDRSDQAILDEWSSHMAPWLLQLQHIGDDTRSLLEQAASRNPEMVDVLHRLYPRIMDPRLIETTRVAAKIKTANE